MIREYSPELVITDIKMPIMDGLELVQTCREEMGSLPLFIILTSYEEFPLIKEALTYQVTDYLIKLELDEDSLSTSVRRASDRLEEQKTSNAYKQTAGRPMLQSYHYKFFMRLLRNLFDSREQFDIQMRELRLDFFDGCYLASHGEIHSDIACQMDLAKQMNLYSSSLQMIREAWENTRSVVHNYFNVWLSVGIGSLVEDPLKISLSYQEARQAFNLASRQNPVFFSPAPDIIPAGTHLTSPCLKTPCPCFRTGRTRSGRSLSPIRTDTDPFTNWRTCCPHFPPEGCCG